MHEGAADGSEFQRIQEADTERFVQILRSEGRESAPPVPVFASGVQILVLHEARIGKNCDINQDVSIGASYGGRNPGVPVIGDNAHPDRRAKIIGGITLGNSVAVGANCVVNIDVSDNGVVIGNPCKIVSYQGSKEYIVDTDH